MRIEVRTFASFWTKLDVISNLQYEEFGTGFQHEEHVTEFGYLKATEKLPRSQRQFLPCRGRSKTHLRPTPSTS